MEIFYILGYYLALFLVPFVVYFVIFKENKGRSKYTSRDWFYFVKFYFAKRAVREYQEKYFSQVKYAGKSLDVFIDIPTKRHANSHYIYGVDQEGNSLSLKVILRYKKVVEVSLFLRLIEGNAYRFPGGEGILQTIIPKEEWKINGLKIEILEPFKRFRITFNGLLQNVSCTEYEKVEHVLFHFIFNAAGSPTHLPHGMDTSLFAEALATVNWKDGSWINYLFDQSGYEQFGALQGFIKGDSYPHEHILNLPACQLKQRGIDDRYLLDRELRIFLADSFGNLINLIIKSFTNGCSQWNYGSVITSKNIIEPIRGTDIVLKDIGLYEILPELITAQIKIKDKLFICVVNLNKSKALLTVNDEKHGYACYNVPAECDINTNQGRALVEFWYKKRGASKFEQDPPLCEREEDDVLPDILVCSINSEESKILELIGGKGNSLALMSSLDSKNFMIPDGFIITVNAYRRQLQSRTILMKSINTLNNICCGKKTGQLEDACNSTVKLFKKERIIPEIEDAIIRELHLFRKNDKNCAWAIRSSAIGEDSEEFSSAGQNETTLGCTGVEQILKAVSSCWASLFTYQSVQYRWQHGLPIITDMAVVVQKIIPADCAGVLFTCHPTTSNPSQMVITSNYGIGETVVSGKSDPDTFILSRTWDDKLCLIHYSLGLKNRVMVMTERGIEEVTREEELEYVEGEGWSATKNQILHLGRVGVELEKAFGSARDIEWAYYEDKLYLLQSRPITTLHAWTDFELTHELDYPILTDNTVLTVANTGEVFPNGMTALSQTTTVLLIDRGMQLNAHRHYDPFVSKGIITVQHNAMLDVINTIHNNVYPKVKISSTILDLAIFGHPVYDEKMNNIAINKLGLSKPLDQIKQFLSILNLARKNRDMYLKMKEDVDDINGDLQADWPLLVIYEKIDGLLNDLLPVSSSHCAISSVSVFYQVIAMNILLERSQVLTVRHFCDFGVILSSCDDVISAEVPSYLEKIARIIRDEGYDEEFCTIKLEFGTSWLQAKCPEAYKLFEEFMSKHGHRTLAEFEVMEESWAENPSIVIAMIQANVKHGKSMTKKSKSIDEVIKSLVAPKSAITKFIIKFVVKKIRSAVGLRELSKSELVRSFNKLRLAYRELGKQMVLRGVLPSQNLIYHLTHYEIGQVIQRRNPLLISKAIKRQKLFTKWSKLKFPEVMYGIPAAQKEDGEVHQIGSVCSGTPVCNGTVTARACVIDSVDKIDQLKAGDILITYSTDIGWTPYFPMLSGIVTELGGLVSHGAVIAREYGLPCIVGVRNATRFFKTGDIVVLSGETGELGKVE